MKKIKNRKGFSLVEVIVSMLIVSIILTFATSFLFTGEKMFANSIKGNTGKMIGDNVLEFISERLTYATNIEVIKSADLSSAKYKNIIYMNPEKTIGFKTPISNKENLYSTDYYNGNTIKLIVIVLPDNCMKVTVKVMDKGEEQYSTYSVIKLMNLKLLNNSIDVDNAYISKEIESPIISFEESAGKTTSGEDEITETSTWNTVDLHYDGKSYQLKLERNKIYIYNGRKFKAKDNANVFDSNPDGLPFPEPWNEKFSKHLIEIT